VISSMTYFPDCNNQDERLALGWTGLQPLVLGLGFGFRI
jgi:hypothetical protein